MITKNVLTLLNTSILTNFGSYDYTPVSLKDVKNLIEEWEGFESAVGHQSTCDVLTSLLGYNVPMNRQQYSQAVGQTAIVFKLKSRPEEGQILTVKEIEEIGYDFGLLIRKS
jgi:Domain of unknown function (DUF1874)